MKRIAFCDYYREAARTLFQQTGRTIFVGAFGLMVTACLFEEDSSVPRLTEDGFGAIDQTTKFELGHLERENPDLRFVEMSFEEEGGFVTVIEGYRQDKLLIELFPDSSGQRVGYLHALSALIRGPDGERIGEGFPDEDFSTCIPGEEQFSGMVICRHKKNTRLSHLYEIPGHDGPDGVLPPEEFTDEAQLLLIVWRADEG
ncbi:DUF1131 family protein [Kiloniella laminariae]|uniref:DUF1131 family protein n=1 Tax=Kiloniella laminariae TaxID=454162 RepID=A0ABT4LH12_9PROT|nr:DUF1131 family protein [Kiloniella laminariae]MCZ4280374.1 DUF1131 family protein [Kiloniella laminariae]